MSKPAIAGVEPVELTAPPADGPPWPLAGRIGFRFLVAYFALFNFALFRNGRLAAVDWLTLNKLWSSLVPWIGKHVLHVAAVIQTAPTGSGDKLYDWLLCATWTVTAAVGAAVWSIVDRRRPRYDRLADLLRVFLRYHLALQMLAYGLAKVCKLQFPEPGPARLSQLYGNSSPMGLLWTFMGASTAYTILAGGAEVLGGILLLFRRTTTLGALVVLCVMVNVTMLNFCYDVPVKLFSLHLTIMALVLIAPDACRLADLLVLHRPTVPRPFTWVPKTARRRWARRIGKALIVLFLVGLQVRSNIQLTATWGDDAAKPSYYGSYDVDEQRRDGQPVPALLTDPTRFRIGFMERRWGGLRTSEQVGLTFRLPPKDGIVDAFLHARRASGPLRFTIADAEHIMLEGTIGGEKLLVRLKRRDTPSLLVSRGFHFVTEVPFNR